MRARNRLALLAAGGFVLVATVYLTATRDAATEARLEALLADALQAPCTFESAEFSFLNGLTVRDLNVLDPEDPLRAPLVAVDTARLDFNLDLLGRGPHITLVHLQSPTVRVRAGSDGRASLASIARRSAEPEAEIPLPVIRIHDGTLMIEGAPVLAEGDAVTLTSIRADVLADEGRVRVPDGFARAAAAGPLRFSLDAALDGDDLSATADVSELDLHSFLDAAKLSDVRDALSPYDAAGTLRVRAGIGMARGRLESLQVDVELTDAGVTVSFPDGPEHRTPDPVRIEIERLEAKLSDGRVTVDRIAGRVFGAPLEITGSAGLAGVLGLADDSEDSLDVDVRLTDAHISPEIRRHLPHHLREVGEAFGLQGHADLRVQVRGPLDDPAVEAHLDVRGASASYHGYADADTGERRGFPWSADGVDGTVDVRGSRVEFAGVGRHGDAVVNVRGFTASQGAQGSHTEVIVDATDVPIDEDLWVAFGDRAEAALGPWRPAGTAQRVEVLVEQIPGVAEGETGTQVAVTLDGRVAFEPDILPIRMDGVTGIVRVLEPVVGGVRRSRVELEDVSARGPGFRLVSADGSVVGDDDDLRVRFAIESLEESFLEGVLASSALPDGTKRALDLLRPHGTADVDAMVTSVGGERDDRVTVTLRGAGVRGWDGVPLAVDDLHGSLRYADDTLATDGLDGSVLGGAALRVSGRLEALSDETPRVTLDVTAAALPLDTRLRDGLGTLVETARAVWEEVPPAEDLRADLNAWIRPPGHPDGQLRFRLGKMRGGVRLLGLEMQVLAGDVRFEHDHVSGSLSAKRGDGTIDVDAFDYATGSGDLTTSLSARGLLFPDDLEPLLDPAAAATVRETLSPSRLHLPRLDLSWHGATRRLSGSGAATLRVTSAGISQPGLHVRAKIGIEEMGVDLPSGEPARVEGVLRLSETSLDPGVEIEELEGRATLEAQLGGGASTLALDLDASRVRVLGLLLENLATRLEIRGERLRLPTITADLYGGALTGRFNKGGDRLAYRGEFEADGVDLALYAVDKQRKAMAGDLTGTVRFRNPGGAAGALEGSGHVEVSGAEVRVPWISASLQAVDEALFGVAAIQGAFHSGHVDFDLRGRRMLVRELYFEGPSVPLLLGATLELQEGRGAIDLVDGRLDLVVYPRLRLGVLGLDPTGIFDRIVGLAQFMVRRQRVEGTTRNPRTRWEVISGDVGEEFRPRPRPIGEVRRYGPEPW